MTRLFGFVLAATLALGFSFAHARELAPFDSRSINDGEKTLLLTEASLADYQHLLAKCGPPKPGTDPCLNVTTIHINVPLSGCVDDLVATTNSSVNKTTGKITVNVTAIEIVNEASMTARCVAAPMRTLTVLVHNSLQKVKGVDVTFQRRWADSH